MNDDQTLYEEFRKKMEKDTLKKYYIILDDQNKVYRALFEHAIDNVVNLASSLAKSYPTRVFTIFSAERMLRVNNEPIIEKKFE